MGWFLRTVVGLAIRPYETVRSTVERANVGELFYIAATLAVYFSLASVVKVAAFRPFLLTRQFIVLAAASAATYLCAVGLFWIAGKLVGAQGRFRGFMLAWGYSLIPTVIWFLATSLLYVILPPPRTTSPQGVLFSILFLVFSIALFFWKVTIGYLALRFGLRLDLGKILIVAGLSLPVLVLWSVGLYRLGIFRIPFI